MAVVRFLSSPFGFHQRSFGGRVSEEWRLSTLDPNKGKKRTHGSAEVISREKRPKTRNQVGVTAGSKPEKKVWFTAN